MRLLIQRVKKATVTPENEQPQSIEKGLLAFLAIHKTDEASAIDWLVKKLIGLRIFEDEQGKMNLSAEDIKGEILVVSQFTLYGNCRNGRRPDFLESASGPEAETLYNYFVQETKKQHPYKVATGKFAAYMEVNLINDGPVTLIIDGK